MKQFTIILLAILLLACNHRKTYKKLPPNLSKESQNLPPAYLVRRDTAFWHKEVPVDSSIESDFRIIYDDYKLYFDKRRISSYCDSIIKLRDGREDQYLNIKREVNHLTNILFIDNDFIILTTFRPKIINKRTKETGKSLLIEYYQNECGETRAHFYIRTEKGEQIKLNRIDFSGCDT